jgi:hypothetical protein
MTKTIIQVHPGDEGQGLRILVGQSPDNIPDGWVSKLFPYNPADPIPAGFQEGTVPVNDMGTYLLDKLSSHPGVKQALTALLGAGADTSQPLYIQMSQAAEAVPWETLFASGAFLALDRRWPIARMPPPGQESDLPKDFEPPLRVMAVLAAAQIDATQQWEGLYQALRSAGLPVRLKVLVAQDDLLAAIKAANDPPVQVEADFVPPGRDLVRATADFRPNILHLFCHGIVTHTFPHIQLATRSSWPRLSDPGHVVLDSDSLPVAALKDSLWLITLNACRGAQAAEEGAGSLVFSLVCKGFQAVAGMREAVSEGDAHAFCRGFYRALMELLKPAATPDQEIDLDLAAALYEPRMEICEEHRGPASRLEAAAGSREWTLPVLYVRPGDFRLRGRLAVPQAAAPSPDRASMEVELKLLRSMLDLPIGTPEPVKEQYRARIKELEGQLYGS